MEAGDVVELLLNRHIPQVGCAPQFLQRGSPAIPPRWAPRASPHRLACLRADPEAGLAPRRPLWRRRSHPGASAATPWRAAREARPEGAPRLCCCLRLRLAADSLPMPSQRDVCPMRSTIRAGAAKKWSGDEGPHCCLCWTHTVACARAILGICCACFKGSRSHGFGVLCQDTTRMLSCGMMQQTRADGAGSASLWLSSRRPLAPARNTFARLADATWGARGPRPTRGCFRTRGKEARGARTRCVARCAALSVGMSGGQEPPRLGVPEG